MTKITTASKKMLALIMAMLMLFSCMAVSASAASFTVPAPTCTLNDDKDAITVPLILVNDVEATITIAPSDGVETLFLADGSTRFDGLSTGKTYTVTATVTIGSETVSNSTSVTIKKSQAAPATPVAKEITTSSITIVAMSGCEYAIQETGSDEALTYAEAVVFSNLLSETKYTIYARKKETTDSYAGAASYLTVTTLKKASSDAPDKPVLVNKTNKAITVKEVNGVEFSIDSGATWQTSGEFKNLTAGKLYGIIARYIFDATEQEAGKTSEVLQVKTNTRESYKASIGSCTFKAEDGKRYSNKSLKITVTGDSPSDLTNPQYGDTRYTPAYYVVDNATPARTFTSSDGKTFVGTFTPNDLNDGDKSNKTVKIVVTYSISKYDGAKWVTVDGSEESATYDVKIGPEKNFLTSVKEALETVLNFLLNTVPGVISDFFNSDEFSNGFNGIMKLLGGIGDLDFGSLVG